MEVQSNPILRQSNSGYEHAWADFSTLYHRGDYKTLSSYCSASNMNYSHFRYWLRSKGLSVKSLKESSHVHAALPVSNVTENKSASFVQFVPSVSSVAPSSVHGICITFPDGINLSLEECSVENIANLLSIYRGRSNATGGQ